MRSWSPIWLRQKKQSVAVANGITSQRCAVRVPALLAHGENMTIIGIDPSFRACGISDGIRHHIIKTEPRDSDATQAVGIARRCREIIGGLSSWLNEHHDGETMILYIEAPAFGQVSQASHLYELGWLMRDLHLWLKNETFGDIVKIVEVSTTALRKWATGKGNTKKDDMKLKVFQKFAVEFDQDPGCDKLFAFLLCRFGEGVEAGKIAFEPSAKRGAKRRSAA